MSEFSQEQKDLLIEALTNAGLLTKEKQTFFLGEEKIGTSGKLDEYIDANYDNLVAQLKASEEEEQTEETQDAPPADENQEEEPQGDAEEQDAPPAEEEVEEESVEEIEETEEEAEAPAEENQGEGDTPESPEETEEESQDENQEETPEEEKETPTVEVNYDVSQLNNKVAAINSAIKKGYIKKMGNLLYHGGQNLGTLDVTKIAKEKFEDKDFWLSIAKKPASNNSDVEVKTVKYPTSSNKIVGVKNTGGSLKIHGPNNKEFILGTNCTVPIQTIPIWAKKSNEYQTGIKSKTLVVGTLHKLLS